MAKKLACGDVVPGCDFVAEGATEEEVLVKAAAHAKATHGMEDIPPEVLAKVKAAIKEG